MKVGVMAVVGVAALLTGCAQPPSQAQQADAAACTAQGDALYNSETVDEQARTAQPGLIYGGTPTHVFDAEQLGAMHARDSAITDCEEKGNTNAPAALGGGAVVQPQIVSSP